MQLTDEQKAALRERSTQLEQARQDLVERANREIAALTGRIEELKLLLKEAA
jgi:hypothetical protein